MRNMKKILAFLLVICTIASTMTSLLMVSGGVSVYADETAKDTEEANAPSVDAWSYFTTPYASDIEKLHKMSLYIENDMFALYGLKKTGEVAVQNKVTGQIMFSNPRDIYLYSTATKDTKAKENQEFKDLSSQLFVDFTILSTNENQILNSYHDAAMNNQITMSAIKNGVAVEYTIGSGDDRKLIPMNIEKTRYEENILNLIEDPNIYKRMSGEGGMYSLKDPFNATEVQKKTMIQQYPVIGKKNIAIYVCDENISNYEKNKIEGWIRAWAPKYTFEELEYDHELTEYVGSTKVLPVFKMALEYKLTDDGFTVRLPASSITFDEDYFKLNSVTILPFMGAGSSEYEGYTLVPDGAGTIIRFEDMIGSNVYKLLGELYGPDNSYHTFSSSYTGKMETWRYPVFGMVENFFRYYVNGTDKEYCGHTSRTVIEVIPASCDTEGYTRYSCEICGEEVLDDYIVPACPTESLKKVSVLSHKATCISVAYDTMLCLKCGKYSYAYAKDADMALGTAHVYETDETGAKTCKLCGVYTPAAKLDDKYSYDKDSSTPVTCQTAGTYVYKAKLAEGETVEQFPDKVITVDPCAHSLLLRRYAASCIEGSFEVTCRTCGSAFQQFSMPLPQPPAGYAASANGTKAATCTEPGTLTFVKKDAEDVVFELPAMHSYIVQTHIVDAGDGKTATVKYSAICEICGEVNNNVKRIASDDKGYATLIKVEITEGDNKYVGDLLKYKPVEVRSNSPKHRYQEVKKVSSDCETKVQGYVVERCGGCGDVRVTASVGTCEWAVPTVMYAATVYTAGLQRYRCVVCDSVRYAPIEKLERIETIKLPLIELVMTGDAAATANLTLREFDEFDTEENRAALVYATSNANVATVAGGVITAVAAGTADITVQLLSGEDVVYHATCTVNVTVEEGESTINVAVQPEGTYKKYDPRGYVAIITEGESLCTVTSIHGGTIYKYNSVYLTVNPRPSDTYELTGALTVSGDAKYTVVSDRKYTGSYRIRYYMLSDQESSDFEATYAGMAKAYRHYLEVTGQLTDLAESKNIPLYLETLGSTVVNDTMLSIPITRDEALTTFDDIIAINDELKAAGITNVHYRLTGYTNGGMNPTMPYEIEYQEVLGGNSGYKDLMKYAGENGIGIYTDYDFAYMHKDEWFDGYSNSDHAVKAIDDRYIIKKKYSATTQSFEITGLLAVSPSVFEYFYETFSKEDAKLGSTGISVSTLGTDLNSDFDSDDPYNREDSKLFVEEVMASMKEDYKDSVMTDGGNSYVLPYAKHILNMSLMGSERLKTSASVPFFSMVLHGAVNYAGKPTNMASSMDEEILHIIENGASPFFVLAYRNQSALKESKTLSDYYAVSYSHWKQDIIDVYNELNAVLGGLQNATYNSHIYLNAERVPGVAEFETTRDKIIEDVQKLFAAEEQAAAALAQAKELLNRFVEPVLEIDSELAAMLEKMNNGTATKQDELAVAALVAEASAIVKSIGKYETNINQKQTAYDTAYNKLVAKVDSVAELFNVTNAMDKNQYTVANYKGYGSFDGDKFTPRAEDFTDDLGEYIFTDYTVADNSVVRTGWDTNGDKKDDTVILLNYNTFDVYVYENGKSVIIPAMGYVVL